MTEYKDLLLIILAVVSVVGMFIGLTMERK